MSSACVRCDKEIQFIEDLPTMPNAAVVLFSSGNYGSTVWDEMHRSILVYVCDKCLMDVKERVLEVQNKPRPRPEYVPWDWEHNSHT